MLRNASLIVLSFYCLGKVFVVSLILFSFNMFTQILVDTRKNLSLIFAGFGTQTKKKLLVRVLFNIHKNDVIFICHGLLLNLNLNGI